MKKYLCLALVPVLFLLYCITVESVDLKGDTARTVASVDLEKDSSNPNISHIDSSAQWAITTIMAKQAWSITHGRPDILIAVLDTGIDTQHEDLRGQIVDSVNFTTSPTTGDTYQHGTHIAGIIAASDNSFGITGVANGCSILNVKVADDGGWCDSISIARGIKWSADRGAKVINISLFILKPTSDLEEAVNYAWIKGAIVVSASGNGQGTKIVYPGYYTNCISVAGTNINDSIPSWSGRGAWIHVAAPGTDIFSTMPNNEYGLKSGTSMASAYVSGLAGLLFSAIPSGETDIHDNQRVRTAIENSCSLTNVDSIGRINAIQAMNLLLNNKSQPK